MQSGRQQLKYWAPRYDVLVMDVVALVGRAILVLAFGVAAVGKLIDRAGTLRALEDFRVPAVLVPPVSWLLPVTEVTVAVLLLVQPVAREASAAAAILLLVFTGGIAAAMLRGEAPDCNCFGQIGSQPAGKGTLARNAALGAVAVFVVAYGAGSDPGSWFKHQTAAEVAVMILFIISLALAAALVTVWSQRRTLHSDLVQARTTLNLFPAGLPVGVVAPQFALPDSSGGTVSLAGLLARGKPVALMFVSPSCRPCHYMLPDIAAWQKSLPDRLTIALIAHGNADDVRAMANQFGLDNMLTDPDATVFHTYHGSATPSMVMINPDGRIAMRIRSSQGAVEGAVRRALRDQPMGSPVHEPTENAPLIQVERRAGRDVQQPA